jgi:ribosomal protein S14
MTKPSAIVPFFSSTDHTSLERSVSGHCTGLSLTVFYRQALRYIIRNTTLPQRTRAEAQIQLSQMHAYTRFTQINNRCIEGGKSRGVLSDFRMARVWMILDIDRWRRKLERSLTLAV